MSSELKVGVAGATGAVGKEVLRVLERSPWRPAKIVPLASPATTTPFVTFCDDQVAVDDLDVTSPGDMDLLFLAVPGDVARAAGEAAAADGVPVVDLSGVFAEDEDVPLVIPWVNPQVLAEVPDRALVSIPGAGTLLLASVLAPLVRAGVVVDVDATLMVPASSWGRGGIEELSGQVVALFNSATPPRRLFDTGLAFDLLPSIGVVETSGRTAIEDRVAAELSEVLELRRRPRVEVIGVPVFSGISASLRVTLARPVEVGLLTRILVDGGVPVAEEPRKLPRPRRVEGVPFPRAGRIRVDGEHLTLWASVDNLRGAAAAAVSTAAVLLRGLGVSLDDGQGEDGG